MTHTLLNMASVSMKINKVSFCFELLLSMFTFAVHSKQCCHYVRLICYVFVVVFLLHSSPIGYVVISCVFNWADEYANKQTKIPQINIVNLCHRWTKLTVVALTWTCLYVSNVNYLFKIYKSLLCQFKSDTRKRNNNLRQTSTKSECGDFECTLYTICLSLHKHC